ncbi:hypothetical protein L873DRAFT_1449005 [Choiromyces venosus 120613-1]|uniref:Uncharacterized protein n=1 Tax=Choiromyces venosus 120613-1 TaxID=1336337 RepID=A0A3N4K4I8_9PEZI|nr:hypothetical protein L873DRAFT_1449005 [Choiromyces venosus 120613-1]
MSINIGKYFPSNLPNSIGQAGACIFPNFIEIAELEDLWQGNIRILGEYSGNVNSFNFTSPNHITISGHNTIDKAHWMCPQPQRNQSFIAQEEIIEGILLRPGKTLAELKNNNLDGIAFYGASGVGKTQVAIQFVQKYRRHTYDVFWIDASTPTTLTKDFQHILDLLKIDTGDDSTHSTFPCQTIGGTPSFSNSTGETAATKNTNDSTTVNDISSQEDLLQAVKSELESSSRENWLLVLDNLTDEITITKFLPKRSNSMIIVTTRSLRLASTLHCRIVEVPRMSPTNAPLLFKKEYHNPEYSETKHDEIIQLMGLLEYLPAKIIDAATHMNKNQISVREYLTELRAARRLSISVLWQRFRFDRIYGRWNGVVAWGCFVFFSVLFAWAVGFRGVMM